MEMDQANLQDILLINKHRLNKTQLKNEYLTAGDTESVEKLPMTGNEIIIPVAILGLIILSYILHKLYIKYKKN